MVGVKSLFSVIKAPLVTEKSTRLTPQRQYVFWVDKNANTIEIKRAVERVYNVKVNHVNALIVKGKKRQIRANQPGQTTAWKKAIVTLKEGSEIKLT